MDEHYPDPQGAQFFTALDDEPVAYARNETNLGHTANYEKRLELLARA